MLEILELDFLYVKVGAKKTFCLDDLMFGFEKRVKGR